jgi:hypothetical protein
LLSQYFGVYASFTREDTFRKGISVGGDRETTGPTKAGAIAEAFYKEIPVEIVSLPSQSVRKPRA